MERRGGDADIRMTMVESGEEDLIRATQMVDRLPSAPIPLVNAPIPLPDGAIGDESSGPTNTPARPFRPTHRPPLPLLLILDDNMASFEQIRLRKANYVIGRDQGDVVISHDVQMSGRHAEIVRDCRDGAFQWTLKDLSSTNGTFVLVDKMRLQNGDELLLGSRICRFELDPKIDPNPRLVFFGTKTTEKRLTGQEHWIGRDPEACGDLAANDPLLDPKHAMFYRNQAGKWHLQSARGVNGVWTRIREVVLRGNCRFQLGEQQFLFWSK